MTDMSLFEDDPQFAVQPSDLIECLSVNEIEHRERVDDPLQAVPNLPFGHLNDVWMQFLQKRQSGDSLWSFAAKWESWGSHEQLAGYVLVRDGQPGEHMLTVWSDEE